MTVTNGIYGINAISAENSQGGTEKDVYTVQVVTPIIRRHGAPANPTYAPLLDRLRPTGRGLRWPRVAEVENDDFRREEIDGASP